MIGVARARVGRPMVGVLVLVASLGMAVRLLDVGLKPHPKEHPILVSGLPKRRSPLF